MVQIPEALFSHGIANAIVSAETTMLKRIKREVLQKTEAVVGIAAIFGLALVLGLRFKKR